MSAHWQVNRSPRVLHTHFLPIYPSHLLPHPPDDYRASDLCASLPRCGCLLCASCSSGRGFAYRLEPPAIPRNSWSRCSDLNRGPTDYELAPLGFLTSSKLRKYLKLLTFVFSDLFQFWHVLAYFGCFSHTNSHTDFSSPVNPAVSCASLSA